MCDARLIAGIVGGAPMLRLHATAEASHGMSKNNTKKTDTPGLTFYSHFYRHHPEVKRQDGR